MLGSLHDTYDTLLPFPSIPFIVSASSSLPPIISFLSASAQHHTKPTMPLPPTPTAISPNICRSCITLIDRTAHPTCSTSGPAHPCAACTLRGSPCEPVPSSLQLQLTDLIYFHARWRTACAGADKAIATKTKKELTANVMDFIELLNEDKASRERGDGGAEVDAEAGLFVPAAPARPAPAAMKTSRAVPAPAATTAGKKRVNDDSQAGGPFKKSKPSTARASKPKAPSPPKQVKPKASMPEKVEKAQKTSRKSSQTVLQKQAFAPPPATVERAIPAVNLGAIATTAVHTTPPRDDRTSYPLATPEIAAMGRTDVVSDPASCDTSLTSSTLPHPAMFASEYLNFDFDFHSHDHPHPQTQSQIPLSSSDTSPSFHSAQHLGSAFQDGTGIAADAIHTHTHGNDFPSFNSNTNVNSSSHSGNHDVSMMILEQLRTMNVTLQGMHEMMKYQAQAQMSTTTSGGFGG